MKSYQEIEEDCIRACKNGILLREEKLKGLNGSIKLLTGKDNISAKKTLQFEKLRIKEDISQLNDLKDRIKHYDL